MYQRIDSDNFQRIKTVDISNNDPIFYHICSFQGNLPTWDVFPWDNPWMGRLGKPDWALKKN